MESQVPNRNPTFLDRVFEAGGMLYFGFFL